MEREGGCTPKHWTIYREVNSHPSLMYVSFRLTPKVVATQRALGASCPFFPGWNQTWRAGLMAPSLGGPSTGLEQAETQPA